MQAHILENKIYYHDTDSGGVVYYGRYLEHLEEARSEYCLKNGANLTELTNAGVLFPVVHLEVDYKSPARYGDIIRIETVLEKVGRASVQFSQKIFVGSRLILESKTIWACVNSSMKPIPVPEDVKNKLLAK